MNIKKLFALILIISTLVTLASCKLIRKIDTSGKSEQSDTVQSESYSTDFPSAPESDTEQQAGTLASEDEAYEFLLASFSDEEKEHITLEKTGNMTAQSNGSQYYIINAEKTSPADDSSDGEEKTESVTFYVSVNGIIYTELDEANATTDIIRESFISKFGEKDSETGLKYKLEYAGLITNKGEYCFNFRVMLEKESGETEYKTNYIVSLDGKASGLQALEN